MRVLLPAAVILLSAAAHAALPPEKIDGVRTLLREKKVAEAEAAARALVKAQPKEAVAHSLLGTALIAKGDADAAVEAVEKAVELAPDSGERRRELGDAYGFAAQKAGMLSRIGWAKKCRAAYEKAVELEPANVNARNSLMGFYQQAPSVMGGGMDKAYAQAAEIRKLDPARGRVAYAMLYAGEKKYAEAFREFEDAIKEAPDNYLGLYQLGRLAAMSGERVDRGIEVLNKCLAMEPTPGSPGHDAVHWRLGNLWETKGDKQAARAAYQASLKVNPSFAQAIESLKKLE